jgi:phosphate/sulfate permease
MTQQELTRRKVTIYALIGVGFAGLIGAHEVGSATASPDDTSVLTVPFVLAAVGTLSFLAAGLMARKLIRKRVSK